METNTLDISIVVLIAILAIIGMIIGFIQMFLYFKLSFGRRNNSKGYTGIEVSEEILKKYKEPIKVKSSFWSITYVRYNQAQKILKLGKIDSRRRSLWTMATVARQTYAAHLIEEQKKGNKPAIHPIWIRLQTFWISVGISIFLNIVTVIMIIDVGTNEHLGLIFWSWLALILLIPLIYSIAAFQTSKVMFQKTDEIFSQILEKNEIEQIKTLFKYAYIQAIVELIKTVLIIVLTILRIVGESQNN